MNRKLGAVIGGLCLLLGLVILVMLIITAIVCMFIFGGGAGIVGGTFILAFMFVIIGYILTDMYA